MDEQAVSQKTEQDSSGNWAVAISVLLFIGIYLSGFVMGLVELSQREATE
jgi:hypothetical protein